MKTEIDAIEVCCDDCGVVTLIDINCYHVGNDLLLSDDELAIQIMQTKGWKYHKNTSTNLDSEDKHYCPDCKNNEFAINGGTNLTEQ